MQDALATQAQNPTDRIRALLRNDPPSQADLDAFNAAADRWYHEWALPSIATIDSTGALPPAEAERGQVLFNQVRTSYDAYSVQLRINRADAVRSLRWRTDLLFVAVVVSALGAVAVAALLWWLLRRWVSGPAEALAREARVVSAGDLNHVVRVDGRRMVTPLFLALVAVELTDLIFAVDSIPAILAISREPFIVFTSNIFAILGLRSLYFLVAGVVQKFRYLKLGLAGVLVFVGLKMMRVTPALAKQHYAEHVEKAWYPTLEKFITGGPIVAGVIEGLEAIRVVREMLGATSGLKAAAGTIEGAHFAVHGERHEAGGKRVEIFHAGMKGENDRALTILEYETVLDLGGGHPEQCMCVRLTSLIGT